MKVVVDDKIPFIKGQVERLVDEVVYLPGNAIGPEDVCNADALIIRTRTHCNRQLLEGSRVRFIATATIGYDHLDTDYLHEAGIQWTNCPGCNATSVAQYVRNSLLVAGKTLGLNLKETRMGIIGVGHVGTAVREALSPYVREIILNDPPLGLNDDVSDCDIITLHTPLTFDGPYPTHHLIDGKALLRMKHFPVLINAARGGVVDEQALKEALETGQVRAAIIDTWEGEPHIDRQLLKQAFIATPHIAGYSADGKANATRMSLEALAHWIGQEEEFEIRPPKADAERTGLAYNPLTDSQRLKETPEEFEIQRGNYLLRRE